MEYGWGKVARFILLFGVSVCVLPRQSDGYRRRISSRVVKEGGALRRCSRVFSPTEVRGKY